MKNWISWVALGVGVIAISVSLWPKQDIIAERIILRDKNGVTRAVMDSDGSVLFSLFSEEEKEMLRITVHSDGSQIDMHGSDARQRVRLSTWGSNYLSIMDETWNKKIVVGDLWFLDSDNKWKTKLGLASDEYGKEEIYFQIPE